MKIAIGCDHGGFELKEAVRGYLEERQIPYEDFGAYNTDSVDYAPIAAKAARAVAAGQADFGVLVCSPAATTTPTSCAWAARSSTRRPP